MKKQLLTAILAFATLPVFATKITQQRLLFLEQLKNIITLAQQEESSLIEIPDSAGILEKAFAQYSNHLTHPTNEHDILLLHIATDMYHNSNDSISKKMRKYSHERAIISFKHLKKLEHNETWLDAVKNGINDKETQDTLGELVVDALRFSQLDLDRDDVTFSDYELKTLYPTYITFYKKHTGYSPHQDDIDNDIDSFLEFYSVPANKDHLDQLLKKINAEIAKLNK
jgi:hypothetical protein